MERNVQAIGNVNNDAYLLSRLEARRRGAYRIVSDLDGGEEVVTAAIGLGVQHQTGVRLSDRHLGAGYYRTARIRDHADDRALVHLRRRRTAEYEQSQH